MKILLAIDSFKGCLTSALAGQAALEGVMRAMPQAQAEVLTVSDGGDGMLDAFAAALDARMVEVVVHDPLMRPATAQYGITLDGTTAIIEMARASGLGLLAPEERDPMLASTFGTGELMADALHRGCTRLIMGLGGSATCDGGRGMLEALGIAYGADEVDCSRSLLAGHRFEIIAACDVNNPLLGPDGSAYVYGPQKGATSAMVRDLEGRMRQFARLTSDAVGHDFSAEPGAGAAGGLGFALMAYMNAKFRSGADFLLDLAHFDERLEGVSLVITGEGVADRQTLMGKLPQVVMNRAHRHGVPTALIAGQVQDEPALIEAGFAAVIGVNPHDAPLSQSMQPQVARHRITQAVARLLSHDIIIAN